MQTHWLEAIHMSMHIFMVGILEWTEKIEFVFIVFIILKFIILMTSIKYFSTVFQNSEVRKRFLYSWYLRRYDYDSFHSLMSSSDEKTIRINAVCIAAVIQRKSLKIANNSNNSVNCEQIS